MIYDQKLMVSIAGRKSRLEHYWWNYERFKVLPLLLEIYMESHYKGLGAAGAGI